MEAWLKRQIEEMMREFQKIREEVERFEEEFFQSFTAREERTVVPLYEVRRSSDKIRVCADLAGVRDKENIDVRVEGRTLKIEAAFSRPFSLEGFVFLRGGVSKYRLEIPLPENIDVGGIKATFRKGVLEVEIPLKVEKFRVKVE
ncbi:Hsp20/alpha crystallin family protein [Infirmifilum lucidum]|uniref:Hsp20/alpha crystallin family protein n=1 Tax=Infirmifilum lucidum TaxID=2776706 RepID=A0A7L9FIW5_9CREN|nr:Hsp20/alpha crystallin family protein [Infirmifilum lucidum]QOJ79581.1 Hsp20/alpha crystallin family protein [Infirmifilum lucidum]